MIELACTVRRPACTVDVSLRLDHAATGLFGPSGAGKSTVLHVLAGLQAADHARLVIDGEVIDDDRRRTPAHRRRVAMVFQDHRLFPHLDVARNLRYGQRVGDGPTFDEVVDLLELAPHLTKRPWQCSGGERQRVALGRALLSHPRLLLLDEPLASLDAGLKRQILPFLRRLRQRCRVPIIHVSHDLDELLTLTDDLVLLQSGRVVAQGAWHEVAMRPEAQPLLHEHGLANLLPATVDAHDEADGITWLRLDGPSGIRCPAARAEAGPGTAVEVLLRPADLVIAAGDPGPVSLTGRLPATVVAITGDGGRSMVRLDLGDGHLLLAELTARGVRALALEPGGRVLVLWKAQAVRLRER
jgi:molybdate transport system ATP-binding protein